MFTTFSALIFAFLTGIVMVFQICLVAGLPWGSASMGGKFPGRYPPRMRIVAVVNIFILLLNALIVLSRANLILPMFFSLSKTGILFVIVFSGIGTVLNTITPSKIERIWAPVAGVQLITALITALS